MILCTSACCKFLLVRRTVIYICKDSLPITISVVLYMCMYLTGFDMIIILTFAWLVSLKYPIKVSRIHNSPQYVWSQPFVDTMLIHHSSYISMCLQFTTYSLNFSTITNLFSFNYSTQICLLTSWLQSKSIPQSGRLKLQTKQKRLNLSCYELVLEGL